MEFRILGPLEITGSDGPIELGSVKLRSVLALLLIRAGEVVSAERLVDDLWEGARPRSAAATLQTYISQLRKQLGAAAVQSVSGGYRVSLEGHTLDAVMFETALDDLARSTAADPSTAAARLRDALGLWRGDPLADFTGAHWAAAEVARLEGLRQVAAEDLTEYRLALGEHARLVPELETVVAANPLQERPWAQLMVALYRCGRQADALRAYGRLRAHLGEELGIEPSSELARLEQLILLHEPELDWRPPPPEPPAAPKVGSSAGLPTGVVTFLLSDVVGSAERWEEHPAAMAEALAAHDALIAYAVETHDGRLLKQRGEGDSTFAVFTRATDALHAAVDAQRSLAKYAWPAGLELRVRMAIHSGEAVERDGDFYGTTVNRAARLRALAEGGHILVSQSTVELCVDHLPEDITLVELGKRSLQGLRRLEHVYAVVSADSPQLARAEPEDVNIPVPGPLRRPSAEPFVGRGEELAVLENAWQAARAGERRAVLLAGEPGIGKTRLAAELAQHVRVDNGIVLFGRCDDELGVAFQPFSEALRYYVTMCSPETLRTHARAGLSELSRLVPELESILPGLSPPRRSDPETERYELFESAVSFLANASRAAPVLLVLDDLHWATKPTLLLVRHLLRATTPMSILVVGTYRSTEAGSGSLLGEMLPDLRSSAGVAPIALCGFSSDEIGEYLNFATGAGDEPVVLAASLERDTHGNPLFVREMIRHLVEHAGSSDDANARKSRESVPQSVRDVIERRLARLSLPARHMLAVAAVVGPILRVDLLERLADADTDADALLDAIDEAIAAGILAEPADTDTLEFTHALIRHTICAGLTEARRTHLHRRVVQALESFGAIDNDDARLPALAYHASQGARLGLAHGAADDALLAGRQAPAHLSNEEVVEHHADPFVDDESTLRYASMAAHQALDRLAYEEAIEYVTRALKVCDPADNGHALERADLLLILADAHYRLLQIPDMREAASAAADAARRAHSPERLAMAAMAFGKYAVAGVDEDASIALCREALAATRDEAFPALRAGLMAILASHLSWAGNETDAERMSLSALELARSSNDADALEFALGGRYIAILGSSRLAERTVLAAEMVNLGESQGRVDTLRQGVRLRAMAYLAAGDLRSFDRDANVLEHFNEQIGGTFFLGLSVMWRGLRTLLDGRFDATERSIEKLLAYADEPNFRTLYAVQLFALWSEQGRYAELLPLIQAAVGMNLGIPGLKAAQAWVSLKLDDVPAATAAFEELTRDGFAEMRGRPLWPSTMHVITELAVTLAPVDILDQLHELFVPYEGQLVVVGTGAYCPGASDRYLGILSAASGRYEEAEPRFHAALSLEEALPSPPLAARTRYWYARMLRSRNGSDDRAFAFQLLNEAADTAHRLGMQGLHADCARFPPAP